MLPFMKLVVILLCLRFSAEELVKRNLMTSIYIVSNSEKQTQYLPYQYYLEYYYTTSAPHSNQQCVGPCVNSQCPAGYVCNAYNVCCAPMLRN
ncbi:unnamed protein product [Cylicocyclus nassatus]|uniref:Uncharacterized protein n=1 Tax=Cylicocyclus nassatus TaxID=53992 RepID=A0AA36DK66_CYLNA|nr:unnamed protein product [Cylicocyclus nassatus]